MNPEIIREAWQAMSVLSDAQEVLGTEENLMPISGATKMRANEQINHAKRHLIRAFDLARAEDPEAFLRAIQDA